jgi:hypothetical protein
VEYTLRHIRRIMHEAGVSWQTPRPQPPTADEEEREAARKDLKKLSRKLPDGCVTVAIDQTKKSVGCDLHRAWFPVGERVKLPYWSSF